MEFFRFHEGVCILHPRIALHADDMDNQRNQRHCNEAKRQDKQNDFRAFAIIQVVAFFCHEVSPRLIYDNKVIILQVSGKGKRKPDCWHGISRLLGNLIFLILFLGKYQRIIHHLKKSRFLDSFRRRRTGFYPYFEGDANFLIVFGR